ncbi:type II toxin-antitoxin system HicB family antitoxin [Lactobacillus crispatus]|uniref:Type II toxin-antitoxin system HicB family antitoxin n=1 Tax=Lactobacillus crispatus TaxID=47770 RepID=A0AAW6XE92_9LACO|nr:type II toxin-antitoxin system HicB family antitoxin [Lactobacillus crispatus]MDK6502401.1 type II toxin-antitoxin system HicB family antitoxin [Lactobacillus crispatus]MDU7058502.1 type II toxin-antitoxin system HicB family antitoxin [Ligilactobacillus salivarius]
MVLYFAIFHKNDDGQYEVNFPDLEPYAATYGDTLEEAIKSAHDSLTGFLLTQEDFHEDVPLPSTDVSKFDIKEPDFIVPVQVDLKLEREKEENKLVKKTLTIPAFLNIKGKEAGLNFSALLSEAIKSKLGIQ